MTDEIRGGIRVDSLDPAVRDCMPSVIQSIEATCAGNDSCFLPQTKAERDRILGRAHVSVEDYRRCLEPRSGRIGASNKAGITFSGIMGGLGATLIGFVTLNDKIRLNVSANDFLWVGVPFLIGAVLFHLVTLHESESFDVNLETAAAVGVGIGGLWAALARRSKVNKVTLPYYLSLGGAGILAAALLLDLIRPEILPSPATITRQERVLSAGNYLINGVGFSSLGLGLYRLRPKSWIPARPVLGVSLALASFSSAFLAYQLVTAAEQHESKRENLGIKVLGLLTGIAIGAGGIALALLPRSSNLADDFILTGVAALAAGGLTIIGTNDLVEKQKHYWKTVLNPS